MGKPFRISIAGIGLNVGFDWLLVGGPSPSGLMVPALNAGAPGLVLATVAVNVITCLVLLLALQLGGAATPADLGPRQPAAHPRRGGCRLDRLGDGAMDSVAERSTGLGFAGSALRCGGWALRTAGQQFWGSGPPTQPSAVGEAARS